MEDIQNTLIARQYNFLVYIIEMTFIKLNKMINLTREGANEIIIKLGSFSCLRATVVVVLSLE